MLSGPKSLQGEPKSPGSNAPGTIGVSDRPKGLRGQSPDANDDVAVSSAIEHEGLKLPKVGNIVIIVSRGPNPTW